jgi:signal transduction histidine kinase
VQSVASGTGSPESARLTAVVDEVDEVIRQIRTSIFELRGPIGPQQAGLKSRVLGIVADLRDMLKLDPEVRLDGPIDTAVPDRLVDDTAAVLREALTNVARHAGAERVEVQLVVGDGELFLEVIDDGAGLGPLGQRSGLANMAARAERNGGRFELESPVPRSAHSIHSDKPGTRLRWTVPLA